MEEKELILKLRREFECDPQLLDHYGKTAFWYAPPTWLERRSTADVMNSLRGPEQHKSLKDDRQFYVDALNAILVGSALIASVTFSSFFQPPLNYAFKVSRHGTEDAYAAINKVWVQVYWTFNSLSFFFGMASVLAGVTGVLPVFDPLPLLVLRLRNMLLSSAALLVCSIIYVLGAFTSAGLAMLPPSLRYEKYMISTVAVGAAVSLPFVVMFFIAVQRVRPLVRPPKRSVSFLELFSSRELTLPSSEQGSPHLPLQPLPPVEVVPYSRTGTNPWDDGL